MYDTLGQNLNLITLGTKDFTCALKGKHYQRAWPDPVFLNKLQVVAKQLYQITQQAKELRDPQVLQNLMVWVGQRQVQLQVN